MMGYCLKVLRVLQHLMQARDHEIPIDALRKRFSLHDGILVRHGGKATIGHIAEGDYQRLGFNFNGRRYRLLGHRVVFALTHGRWPESELDHKNRVKIGNDADNLHEVTQNSHNRPVQRNNKLGVKGVYIDKWTGLYRAEIKVGGKRWKSPRFATLEEAIAARRAREA
jgi:HNH endonuclease